MIMVFNEWHNLTLQNISAMMNYTFPAMYITLNAGCITHVLHMY